MSANQALTIDIRAGMAMLGRDIQQARTTFEGGVRAMESAVDRLDDSLDQVEQGVHNVGAAFGGLRPMVSAVGNAMQAIAGAAVVHQLIDAERQFGILSVQLEVATGSAQAAQLQFSRLEQLSSELPSTLEEVTNAYVKLKNMGLDPSEAAIASYANTSAAMGKSLEQMVEAVADATTGEFERLKEFGIKASVEKDKVSLTFKGVTTTIGNSAAAIEQYLRNIGDVDFAGSATKRMQELDGAISNMGDAWGNLLRTLNQQGPGELMADGARAAADGMTALAGNIGAVSTAATALGAIVAGRVTGPLLQQAVAARAAARATLETTAAELESANAQLAGARAAAVYGGNKAALTVAEHRATAAVIAHAAAQREASVAMGVAAAAGRGLGAVYAAMGGPFGIFMASAALVVAYWDDIAEAAGNAAAISENSAARIQKALNSSGGAPMRVIQDEIVGLQKQMAGVDAQLNSGKKTIYVGRDERPAQVGISESERRQLTQDRETLRGALLGAQKAKSDLESRQMQNTESWISKWNAPGTSGKVNGAPSATTGRKSGAYGKPEDRALADLSAQIDSEKQLAASLAAYGLEVDKLTPGQKLLNKLRQELTVATTGAAKAHVQAKIDLAEQLVQQELANVATKKSLEKESEDRKKFFDELDKDVAEYERNQKDTAERLRDLYESPYARVQRENSDNVRDISYNQQLSDPEKQAMLQAEDRRYQRARSNLTGGMADDMGMRDETARILEAHRDRQRQINEITADGSKERADFELANQRRLHADLDALERQKVSMVLGMSGQVFDGLAAMAEQAAGRQSTAYKIMFALNKAASIAMAIVNTEEAATKALALGPILGVPAATMVRALGYASVGVMAAQAVQGMAHDGIDHIPREGTWLLDKGERVVDSRTNADLKTYLSRQNAGVSSGSSQVSVTVINNAGAQVEVSQSAGEDGGVEVTIDIVKKVADGVYRRNLARDMLPGGALYGR